MEAKNPNYRFYLFDDESKDHFMLNELNWTKVTNAYFCVDERMGAARADIWRYAVLWKYGGIYIDYDSESITPLDVIIDTTQSKQPTALLSFGSWGNMEHQQCVNENNLLKCIKKEQFNSVGIAQWVLISPPKHPFFAHTLNQISDTIQFLKKNPELTFINNSIYDLKYNVDQTTGPQKMFQSIYDILNISQQCNVKLTIPYKVLPVDWNHHFSFKSNAHTTQYKEHTHWTKHTNFTWINPRQNHCV